VFAKELAKIWSESQRTDRTVSTDPVKKFSGRCSQEPAHVTGSVGFVARSRRVRLLSQALIPVQRSERNSAGAVLAD